MRGKATLTVVAVVREYLAAVVVGVNLAHGTDGISVCLYLYNIEVFLGRYSCSCITSEWTIVFIYQHHNLLDRLLVRSPD